MIHTHFTTLISPQNLDALMQTAAGGGAPVVIFDCRFDLVNPAAGEAAYVDGHIFGAFYAHLERDLSGKTTGKNGRHPLPDRDALVRYLADCGLSNGQQAVAYDAQGGRYAARLWWLLRWLGHESVAVLDGGLQAWEAAGFKLDAAPPETPPAGDFSPGEPLATTADAAAVERNLTSHERLVIDARAADRYRGENETIDPIGGHIPGAVNRCFEDNLGPDGRFKPAATLREAFMQVIGKDRQPERVISQCGSGVTACHNLLAMEVAGLHGASLYPGSWSEWCADKRRPVATGAQP
ncbi:3-mercaptopyruvate sulfurtransferase [Pandoraea communis]|uniref:Sulfurtransferase n=1 Tax=Pandoraea communis TaxID=2508297 RepID=A0A5E4UGE6_9BURK|nr:sulfurtransferase [Pandoraea communis]VVD99095.1 3-mercaptopyruvate sulfurtransferase [Pandoraea communis]